MAVFGSQLNSIFFFSQRVNVNSSTNHSTPIRILPGTTVVLPKVMPSLNSATSRSRASSCRPQMRSTAWATIGHSTRCIASSSQNSSPMRFSGDTPIHTRRRRCQE